MLMDRLVCATFSGTLQSVAAAPVPDRAGHELGVQLVAGRQHSSDENWNGGWLTYAGLSDTTARSGEVRGYFFNEHPSGDRAFGTFVSAQTASDAAVTFEGKWKFEGGTGRFATLHGDGEFKGKWTSPTTIDMTWDGAYGL